MDRIHFADLQDAWVGPSIVPSALLIPNDPHNSKVLGAPWAPVEDSITPVHGMQTRQCDELSPAVVAASIAKEYTRDAREVRAFQSF